MKEKSLIIDMEFIKKQKTVGLIFENCDEYEIDAMYVRAISFTATPCILEGEKKQYYKTDNGFISLAPSAGRVREKNVISTKRQGEKLPWDYPLFKRLKICADVCWMYFCDKEERKMEVILPYDPLLNIFYSEIEFSNCPSFEVNKRREIIVCFGECSKSAKREDNNYGDLIHGWMEKFGDFSPELLTMKVSSMERFGEKVKVINIEATVQNKEGESVEEEFVFCGCREGCLCIGFPLSGETSVAMSRRENGRIYVGFAGLGVDFECDSVWTHEEYNHQFNNT